ncbi:dynamin family protein [Nocardia sp. alder85J]|uniref:dynamin family protein n=1 Tax=Nocardia sp. alder85J TaxID=2862949 RepID=UPI001CD5EF3B|nr:dynamin family protein [Nocardia sp. alder85J]MCX4093249.1 dynamin family protein [Nocardia sp. alder85J]
MSAPALVGKVTDTTATMIEILSELQSVTDAVGRTDLSRRLAASTRRVGDDRLRIVVTGESRAGLSSIVNALVAADVSPVGQHTPAPAVIEHGERVTRTPARRDALTTVTTPAELLAAGIVLVDTPGLNGVESRSAAATLDLLPTADAVLFVTDAARELSAADVRYLKQLQAGCAVVACVINKIDANPRWADVQRANRKLLTDAGLDLPLLPVSAATHRAGHRDSDNGKIVESGVPQLTGYLRDHLLGRAALLARESVINDVRVVSDQVTLALNSELTRLQDPQRDLVARANLEQARQAAVALRKRTSNWPYALGDGVTELNVAVEHDLRNRLRALIREAEHDIAKADPSKRWAQFNTWLDDRINTELTENFLLAQRLSVELAGTVASRFADEERHSVPRIRIADTTGVLDGYGQLEELESAKGSVPQRAVSALRGSYSGVLMIGVATTLAGLALVNPWSIAAGLLLGGHTVWEDVKNMKARRQLEAKIAVGKLMDEVSFQVGKESKQRLREVQRTLRDHFTEVAEQRAAVADAAIADAARAVDQHEGDRRDRVSAVAADLERLQRIRVRAAHLVGDGAA